MERYIVNAIDNSVEIVELTSEEIAAIEAKVLADFEASWIHKDRHIRVFMSDNDFVALIKIYPPFASYPQENGIPVEEANGGQYLYLNHLFPEHEQMFEMFESTIIEDYSPQP